MPYRTFKYIVVEADTRALEFWLALLTIVWSLWLGLVHPTSTDQFWIMLAKFGGGILVFIGFCIGVLQMWAIHWKYPKSRSSSAYFGTAYWCYWVYMVVKTNVWMSGLPIYIMFALGCAASLIHRTATGK